MRCGRLCLALWMTSEYDGYMEVYQMVREYLVMCVNIFVFLPYFFSIDVMAKTLFAPWKRIVLKEKRIGFSFEQWASDMMFGLISRVIGMNMRLSVIGAYIIILILYVPLCCMGLIVYICIIIPVKLILSRILTPEEIIRERQKTQFMLTHTLDAVHESSVKQWYDQIELEIRQRERWWDLSQLLTTPPLARDWAQGYTPTLDQFATDLSTDDSKHDGRPMTIGRESEMKKIEDVLCKSQDANILITGEPGVGKTTAIESLAYRIYIGRCHPLLAFKRLMDLNLEGILAQHTDMKVREEVLSRILQEAHAAGNIIIVIHRIDRYLSSGEGRIDLSTPIQKYLAQPGVQVIGITTPAAYERYIRPKAEVAQHFTQLPLQEIAPEVALQIILRNYYKYEKRYSVTLPYETCVAAVQKSAYFITTIPFPEKALQLLDDACVYVKNHVTEKVVKPTIIDTVLTTRLHVPTVVDDVLKQKLMSLEQDLGTHVIGQERALRLIAQALQRAFVMLGKRKKPLASFLLLGPTGVGKTETAKVLATHFFTDESSLIRFDMSQFQRVDDIPKLIGDTSTGDPGLLVSALRKQPYGVLLLDEIEKASKDLLNVFLTVMDEGYIADATGARVDCKSLIIIATSNAGALDFYHAASPDTRRGDGALMQFLIQNRYFSPEFLNRFDGVIAYEPLTTEVAVQIGTLMVHAIVKDIALLHGVTITVGEETIRRIVHDHFNPVYGARDLARAIKDSLETDIAQRILTGALKPGSAVTL